MREILAVQFWNSLLLNCAIFYQVAKIAQNKQKILLLFARPLPNQRVLILKAITIKL